MEIPKCPFRKRSIEAVDSVDMSVPLNLYFQSYGSGKPLIILHGLLGSSANWTATGKILADHFTVYALDLRNHGNSPGSEQFDYPIMARDLKKFMDDRKIDSANIIGHSMGGKVAMVFADLFPECVDKLIIVDIALRSYPPYHQQIIDAMIQVGVGQYKRVNQVIEALSYDIPSLPVRYFLAKNLVPSLEGGLCWKVNLAALSNNGEKLNVAVDLNHCFHGPALFIRGGNSFFVKKDDYKEIFERFPASEIITIKEAGHWVHVDAKKNFIDAVLKFCSEGKTKFKFPQNPNLYSQET